MLFLHFHFSMESKQIEWKQRNMQMLRHLCYARGNVEFKVCVYVKVTEEAAHRVPADMLFTACYVLNSVELDG